MATLASMPPVTIDQAELARFGSMWSGNEGNLSRMPPYSSGALGISEK